MTVHVKTIQVDSLSKSVERYVLDKELESIYKSVKDLDIPNDIIDAAPKDKAGPGIS